ncbi:MAG: 50S ribosomal protein L23 [Chloroflexi bacterium]|uniref:50S ribosomal protein L23 n=1 Tax=Candidatus Flexifilum breve TaxID=3140694 RepID=UPI0031371D70|nr:50S ribosomal protein L23 [Chloroflexota bacterium]
MAELHLYDVLRRPVITEKSSGMMEANNQYVFEVHKDANKPQIRQAVETIFDVKVVKVNTLILPAKRGVRGRHEYRRSQEWKKAIVTLAPGDKIEMFEV